MSTPLEIIEEINRLKAVQIKPVILEGLLRNVYSKYQFDENGRVIYDEDLFRQDRAKYLAQVVLDAENLPYSEKGGILEAVSQIFSEIPMKKRSLGQRFLDAIVESHTAQD